jgi:hypothetical protein
MKPKPRLLFLAASVLLTLACLGTPANTEIPIATEPPPGVPSAGPGSEVPPVSSATTVPIQETAMPPSQPSGLKVAFELNGNIWFWSESTPARQLTQEGDAGDLKISRDGLVIAYRRGQTIWAVNADGSNPRQLVDASAFAAPLLPSTPEPPLLGDFQFQPGTHMLYFHTRYRLDETYGIPPNDLYRVDADTPEPQSLLTRGGGDMTISPDGRLIALARTDRINIVNADGSNLLTALEFTAVNTYSDWSYAPQVVWLSDATGFYTVIPASDPNNNPAQLSRFLYVSPTGAFSAQLAEFPAAPVRVSRPLIAPDGSKVTYVTQTNAALDIHVIDASTADLTVAAHPNSGLIGLWAWSPDSKRFAYWTSDPANLLLTGINLPSASLVDASAPYSLRWVNTDRFLYFRDGELRLGQVGTPMLTVIASGFPTYQADTRYYDFAP